MIRRRIPAAGAVALALLLSWADIASADEPGLSPHVPKILGQEDLLYVWTAGVEGLGDGSDKLVTLGVNPDRPGYGKVISTWSVGGREGAHRLGLTDDRRYLWASSLEDDRIFVFDLGTNPAHPELVHRMDDFAARSGGVVGPNALYALPGRMMITGLSNAQDGSGRTGIVEFTNEGEFVRTTWMPEGAARGYDVRIDPRMNRMLTTSFTGRRAYRKGLGSLLASGGNTVVVWDARALKPLQILEVPGAPLEIRWALRPRHDYAFTATALTSRLWGIFRKKDGSFEARDLAAIGDPDEPVFPVDLSLSSNDHFLFVTSFRDGTVRVFDVRSEASPELVGEKRIGSQLGAVSQSWDGERLYFTSSFFHRWDRERESEERFVKAFSWDGDDLEPLFELDFGAQGLGRPRDAVLGSIDFYRGRVASR